MMFFNLLTLSVPDVTPGCFEKHPTVTSGTLKVKRLKNILEKRQVRSNSTD
jgi:hypothetical protein